MHPNSGALRPLCHTITNERPPRLHGSRPLLAFSRELSYRQSDVALRVGATAAPPRTARRRPSPLPLTLWRRSSSGSGVRIGSDSGSGWLGGCVPAPLPPLPRSQLASAQALPCAAAAAAAAATHSRQHCLVSPRGAGPPPLTAPHPALPSTLRRPQTPALPPPLTPLPGRRAWLAATGRSRAQWAVGNGAPPMPRGSRPRKPPPPLYHG